MFKKIVICVSIYACAQLLLGQQQTTFAGQQALRYDIAPNLTVYASACTRDKEAAICFDVSYGRIASAARGLLSMAGGFATGGDSGTVSNILDDAPHNGRLFVTASKVAFKPDGDESYAWEIDRNELSVKHQKNWGEELRSNPHRLHGILNFRPRDNDGQFAWSNGSAAKVLVAKSPEDNAARLLGYFYSSVSDFATAYSKIVN